MNEKHEKVIIRGCNNASTDDLLVRAPEHFEIRHIPIHTFETALET